MKAYIITPITIITVFILLKLPLFGSEQIYVASKETYSEYRCSGAFGMLSCHTYYYYKVNGKHVDPNFYDDVEKGRTYLCKRTVLGALSECEEVGGEDVR